jgi:Cys-tRNA(Pro)/Cys-tRNA(Cys) deacylase
LQGKTLASRQRPPPVYHVGVTKTNAMRLLERDGIEHGVAAYPYHEEGMDAHAVAAELGVPPERVFKTLVARDDRAEILVFCLPGSTGLDLKKAAGAAGSRKVEMVRAAELFELTGYVRGGCSPIGMKKTYRTFIDEAAQLFDRIYVSAGVRGLQIEIAWEDLASITGAALSDLTAV